MPAMKGILITAGICLAVIVLDRKLGITAKLGV